MAGRTRYTERGTISSNVSISVDLYKPHKGTVASLLHFVSAEKPPSPPAVLSTVQATSTKSRLFETSGSGKRFVGSSSRTFIFSCALTMLAARMNNKRETMQSNPVYHEPCQFAPFGIIPETLWILRTLSAN